MSQPVPPGLDMLGWHCFHMPVTWVPDPKKKKNDYRAPRIAVPVPGLHEWGMEHLKGRWTWGSGEQSLRSYYIEDKQDAMLFKLTWFDATVKPKFRA